MAAFGLVVLALGACGGTPSHDDPLVTLDVTSATSPSPEITLSPSPSPSPTFMWETRPATVDDLGSSWREGCPVGPESLEVVTLSHWTFNGYVQTGELVINVDIDAEAQEAFGRLFDLRFPIRSMRNVDEYESDDNASMAADNTSAFNCRYAVADGDPQWSNHAYGRAIDVNPVENPYVFNGVAMPPEGEAFVDRVDGPGLLIDGGEALAAFEEAGFFWGGVWSDADYQHVEIEP